MTGGGALLLIDGGTTHTRVWAVRPEDGAVLHTARAAVGARDGVDAAGRARLAAEVARLCDEAASRAASLGLTVAGSFAAGMVGSAQGLVEVPHVPAPAGATELAQGARPVALPGGRTLTLVPGVRFGPERAQLHEVGATDVVRGEEVLCLGLHAAGLLPAGGALLSLGSHWKRLSLDGAGRLAHSTSCLSGELYAAVARHTILASALPEALDGAIDVEVCRAGAALCERDGLGRALYAVRLLALRAGADPERCRAFLLGAILGGDLPHLLGGLPPDGALLLVGRSELCRAVAARAADLGCASHPVSAEQAEAAVRAGLLAVAAGAR